MTTFFGTLFNDDFVGNALDNTLIGSVGNDSFNGSTGFDTANYSFLSFPFTTIAQSITLLPTGRVTKGILGTDQLISVERIIANASAGNNLIDAFTAGSPATIDVNLGANQLIVNNVPGIGTLTFTVVNFDDVIGTSGNDSITGDFQNNILSGSAGNDTINGGDGNDFLNGGDGDDFLDGGFGFDTINGGSGNDTTSYSFFAGPINANLGTGVVAFPVNSTFTDTLISIENIIGTNGNDTLAGSTASNNLQAGAGNDLLLGTVGNDTLNGGTGNDTARYQGLGRITVLPTGIVVKNAGGGTDDTISIETIIADATASNNTIDAATAAAGASLSVNLSTGAASVSASGFSLSRTFVNFDDVIGTNGNDSITGDFQNNILSGGAGNDTLNGAGGNDTLIGGIGADVLTGGTGTNTFVYNGLADGGDSITDFISIDLVRLRSSGFAGLNLGTLAANRYGEGSSLTSAAFAALSAGAGFGAAVLGVSSGSNVQVWYTSSAFITSILGTGILGTGATLLATLNGASLGTISQANFSITA